MSKLQGWSKMLDETVKIHFTDNGLWKGVIHNQEWEQAIVDPVMIKQAIVKLSEDERQVLDCLLSGLLLQAQLEEVVVEQLSEQLSISKRQCHIALHTLAQGGILVCFQHPWHGKFMLMPLPIYQIWREVLRKQGMDIERADTSTIDANAGAGVRHAEETAPVHVQQVLESGDTDVDLLQQLHGEGVNSELPSQLVQHCQYAHAVPLSLSFLLFLNELTSQQLTFTKQGELSKKLIKQLHKQIEHYADVNALRQLWRMWFASGEASIESNDGEAAVKLLLELAYDLGLIEREAREFIMNGSKLKEWLMLTQDCQDDIIWQWLLQHGARNLERMDSVTSSFRSLMLTFLIDLYNSNGAWTCFSLEHAEGSLCSDDIRQLIHILDVFRQCGLVSFSVDPDNIVDGDLHDTPPQLYAKRENAAERHDHVHLEPNGELYILPGTMPQLMWQALEVAELNVIQEIVQLRVTVQSLQRCHERGHSYEHLRQWLEQAAAGMLPSLVLAMLEQAFAFRENKHERATDHIREPFIPLHIEVPTGENNLYTPIPLSAWGCFTVNPLGKLGEGELLPPFQWNDHWPITEITRSWRTELRRYHSSTMQQIVETALQHGLALIMKVEGKVARVVPKALQEEAGAWTLIATAYAQPALPPLQINLECIEAIQLDGVDAKGA